MTPQPQPSIKPSLDESLAAPCKPVGKPRIAGDYDALQDWVEEVVLPNYVDCAIRHKRTVEAWPK